MKQIEITWGSLKINFDRRVKDSERKEKKFCSNICLTSLILVRKINKSLLDKQ